MAAAVLAPCGRGPPPPPLLLRRRRLRSARGRCALPSAAAAGMRPRFEAAPVSPLAEERGGGGRLRRQTGRSRRCSRSSLGLLALLLRRAARRQLGCCGRRRGTAARCGPGQRQPGRAGPGEHSGPATSSGPRRGCLVPLAQPRRRRRWGGAPVEPVLGAPSQPAPGPGSRARRRECGRGGGRGGPREEREPRVGLAVARGGGQSARVGEGSLPAAAFPARFPSAPRLPPDDAAPSLRVPRAALAPPNPPVGFAAIGAGRNSPLPLREGPPGGMRRRSLAFMGGGGRARCPSAGWREAPPGPPSVGAPAG